MLTHRSAKGCLWKKYDSDDVCLDAIQRCVHHFGISYFLARILAFKIDEIHQTKAPLELNLSSLHDQSEQDLAPVALCDQTIIDIQNFLDPKLKNLMPIPMSLLDTRNGIERLMHALDRAEVILIFADYDVDGATSCALLYRFLRQIGYLAEFYIPNRLEHGYGFTMSAFEDCYHKYKPKLIITLDCGTTSCDTIKYAKTLLVDVIVIDHHLSPSTPQMAVATINPNRADENNKYTYLAAVGVTFYFLFSFVFVARKVMKLQTQRCITDIDDWLAHGYSNELWHRVALIDLMQYLDIVALGTVCDVMKLVGVNRVFVKHGLKQMRSKESGNKGIKALLGQNQEQASVYHLGFIVGPRINAGGRVSDASLGTRLLIQDDDEQIDQISKELELANQKRQLIEENYLEEAMQIACQKAVNNDVVFVYGHWHEGVIGIIASRLKEKLEKPVIVGTLIKQQTSLSLEADAVESSCQSDSLIKASCRSTMHVDLGKIIIDAKNAGILISGGGHAMAAGLTMNVSKVEEFEIFLREHSAVCRGVAMDLCNRERVYVDELSINSLNSHLMLDLEKLEPYGNGNNEPIFLISELFAIQSKVVGKKHISCVLLSAQNSKSVRAIAFNAVNSEMEEFLMHPRNRTISVLASAKVNEWNGRKNWQLVIHDLCS